jgi:hypothetical protein
MNGYVGNALDGADGCDDDDFIHLPLIGPEDRMTTWMTARMLEEPFAT